MCRGGGVRFGCTALVGFLTTIRESQTGCCRLHPELLGGSCERCNELSQLLLDWVPVEAVRERLVVQHVFTLDALRVVQQGNQVLDVGAGQAERVDLGKLPVRGISRHQLPELIESRVDGMHPLSFPAVGCDSLHFAMSVPGAVWVVAIRLCTVSIGAATARAPSRTIGVGLVPVLRLAIGAGPFGAGDVLRDA